MKAQSPDQYPYHKDEPHHSTYRVMAPKRIRLPDGSFEFKNTVIEDGMNEDAAIKEAIEACHTYGEASVEVVDTYYDADVEFTREATFKSYQLDDEGRVVEDA